MTAVHIAVAAAAERRRRVLEAFRKANATSVSRARPQEELGIPDDPVLKDFLKSGAVRRAPDGRLWLDEEALREARIPPEARAQKELVLAAVRALADCPDAQLVKVRTEDASVDIIKDGDTLRIAVDADDAVVRCNIPIDGVAEALEQWDWETADPKMLFDVLRAAENGELVTVATDDGVRVAITMW